VRRGFFFKKKTLKTFLVPAEKLVKFFYLYSKNNLVGKVLLRKDNN